LDKPSSLKAKLSLLLYSLAGYLLLPIILLYLARRMLKSKDYQQGFWQRLGFIPKQYQGCIHIHCASLGEVNAAKSLIQQLVELYPSKQILVTNSTPTGAAQVNTLFSGKVTQLMAPIDTWGASRRFARRIRPQLSIFTEVEIWPNWLHALKRNDAKLLLANARLSEKSFKRYQKFSALFLPCIACFDWIGCQSKTVAERYQTLSASKVVSTGNLKFDIKMSENLTEKVIELGNLVEGQRDIWVGASVHPIEYQAVISAHLQLKKALPNILLILVPRHPEQFESVASYLTEQQIAFVKRSEKQSVSKHTSVWLIDTLGELISFYAFSDMAFVGGSLVNRGGHNPLEPAALAKPVLMGPFQDNCLEICQALREKRALGTIENPDELANALLRLWSEPALYQQAAVGANDVIMENQGATEQTLDAIRVQVI